MSKILIIYSNNSPVPKRFVKLLNNKYTIESFYCNNVLKAIKKIVLDFMFGKKYSYLIAINSTWNFKIFIYYIFSPANKKIFFPYDITNFYSYKRYPLHDSMKRFFAFKIDNKLEEIMFRVSDKIIHKGLKDELEFLPFYDKIKHKPEYLFRIFLDPDLVQKYYPKEKLSCKDKEIHFVYIGGVRMDDNHPPENFWKFYSKITKQNIHLHIYTRQPEKVIKILKNIEKNDSYFHYQGFRVHDDLIKELTKYDYGIHLFGREKYNISEKYLISKIAFANKIFDYITAKLPVITVKDLPSISEFIEKNKLGITIGYKNIRELKKHLHKVDYLDLLQNIDNYISKYTLLEKRFLRWLEK